MPKKFIVVGHPRSGSTFLIDQLAQGVAAETPSVNHEELFNVYEKLFNVRALRLDGSTEVSMLESFFAGCTKTFAGFKTIPSFHREWPALVRLPDIQFITIERTDILSCIASMLISQDSWNWRLAARDQLQSSRRRFSEWFQDRRAQEMILGELLNRLLFDLRELDKLKSRQGTIALTCEALVGTYRSAELDEYFERPILLQGFSTPTDYRECFDDADTFRDTVIHLLSSSIQYDTFIPTSIHDLIVAGR